MHPTESQPLEYESTVTGSGPVRRPIAELMLLALPTIMQMLAYTAEQFIDTLMLSRVSDDHATAAGYAGGVVFCVISFGFGVLMLVNALVSEAYGAGKFADAGRSLWQGIWFALAYSIVVAPLMFCAHPIFTALGHPPALVALEVAFFNVSIALLAVKMLAIAFGQFMLAVSRPMVVFWAAFSGMFVNIGVNYLLIYGNLGFPKLGIAGAAWGTNSAVLTELIIVAIVAFRPWMRMRYGTLRMRFDGTRFKELLRIGLPSGVQTAGDVIAWTLFFTYVMASFGHAAMAANNYMIQYMKLSFMPAFGLSTAVTALVARYIGAGRPDMSIVRANLGFRVTAAYMTLLAIAFIILREPLMRVFTSDPEVVRIGARLTFFFAIFQFFDAMFVVYVGALRGAKDTFVPTVVQITLCWILIVAGGLAVAHYKPEWSINGPWSLSCVYCIILGLYLAARFNAGKWRRDAVDAAEHGDHAMAAYAAEAKRVEAAQ